jgi:hypothetical protein
LKKFPKGEVEPKIQKAIFKYSKEKNTEAKALYSEEERKPFPDLISAKKKGKSDLDKALQQTVLALISQ